MKAGVFVCSDCGNTLLLTHIDNASFSDLVSWSRRCPSCEGSGLRPKCVVHEGIKIGSYKECEMCSSKFICITSKPTIKVYPPSISRVVRRGRM